MTRFEPRSGTRDRAGSSLVRISLAVIAALASACAAGPITVEASDARALTRATTVFVTVTPHAGGSADSADSAGEGSGTAASSTAAAIPTAPGAVADEGLLRAEAENALRARGYAIGDETDSDLILEIVHRIELESVRTWSSDPDASGARQVERAAGVITLRAHDPESGLEVWTCDARALLPRSGLFFEADAQTVWSQILAQALERVPSRS